MRHLNPLVLDALELFDDFAFSVSRIYKWLFKRRAQGPLFDPKDEEQYKKWRKPKLYGHRILHKVRRKGVEEIVEPCPGIYEVLKLLQDKNIPIALASNGLGKGYGHEILEKFDLEKYFPVTVFREDIRKSKPNPEGLLKAINALKTPGKDDVVWFIGDRHKDVTATQNVGSQLPCPVIPIAYGLNASIAILEKGLPPDHIIMSHPEIFKKLKELL